MLGIAVAMVPAIAFNLLLWFHLRTQGDENIRDAARSMMQLTEHNLDDAMTQLVSVGMRADGPASCSADRQERLRQAVTKAPQIAEIGIFDARGEAECVSGDIPRVSRALSPQNDTATENVAMSIVDFGSGPRSARLTMKLPNGRTLSALLPGERLMPAVVVGRLQADFVSTLALVDGTLIAMRRARGEVAGRSGEDQPVYRTSLMSERYPVSVEVVVESAALRASYRDLFLYGNLGAAVLTLVIVAGALVIARQSEGPVRDIDDSLRRGDFIAYYQPVIDLRTGKLLGCEALVRRRRRDGGIDGPASFIPLAEASGQIHGLTRAVMTCARDELGPVYALRPHLKISFNLVAAHFTTLDTVSLIRRIFDNGHIQPRQLVFEVTERQSLPDLARARLVIAELQDYGARVSLDDVGTGHGGLSYLLKLGVDQMKMDKMFVDAIGTDRYSAAIVDTLIKLADELSMELVAEGVETIEQVAYLRRRGVRAAQGYVFAPPLRGEDYIRLIEAMEMPVPDEAPARRRVA